MNNALNSNAKNVENNSSNNLLNRLTQVPDKERLNFFPTYFPKSYIEIEQRLYSMMQDLTKEYNGGLWEFYIYTTPDHVKIPVVLWDSNLSLVDIEALGFQTTYQTSPLIASYIVWTMAVNHTLWNTYEVELNKYWQGLMELAYRTFTNEDQSIFHDVLD